MPQESSASPLPSSTASSLTSFGSAIESAYIQDESQDLTTAINQVELDLLPRERERQIHSIKTQVHLQMCLVLLDFKSLFYMLHFY